MFSVLADNNLISLFDFMRIVAKENVIEDFSLKLDSHHNMLTQHVGFLFATAFVTYNRKQKC